MVHPAQVLETVTLNGIVDQIDMPARFLRNLLIKRERTLQNQTIEVGRNFRGRQGAPFSPPGATALIVGRRNRSVEQFTAPNIRIKRSINPGDFMFERELNEEFYFTSGGGGRPSHVARFAAHVAETMTDLEDMIQNTEEWMVASEMNTGTITYDVLGEDSFFLDLGRPGSHTTAVGGGSEWNQPGSYPPNEFLDAARLIAMEENVAVTHCIMSRPAAVAFLRNASIIQLLDNRGMSNLIGRPNLQFGTAFQNDGTMRYLGNFMGVECWEYDMVIEIGGSMVNLLDQTRVYFVSAAPNNGWEMNYAAIPDLDAIQSMANSAQVMGGMAIGKRFAKSWRTPDPTSQWIMLQSRPLPVTTRPGVVVSYRVL